MRSITSKRITGLAIFALIFMCLLFLILCNGCMSLLREGDWQKLDRKLESVGMTEEERKAQLDEWKGIETEVVGNINEIGKQIKDLGIDVIGGITGMPEAVKDGTKDWTDDLMKWLLLGGGGTAVLGGLGASMRNSRERKLFGPIFNSTVKKEDLTNIQKEIRNLMDSMSSKKEA